MVSSDDLPVVLERASEYDGPLPIFRALTLTPVFEGHDLQGHDLLCPGCAKALARSVTLAQLIDIGFKCGWCGSVCKTPAGVPGRPIPRTAIGVPNGTYNASSAIRLSEKQVFASLRAIERRLNEVGIRLHESWSPASGGRVDWHSLAMRAETLFREELPFLRQQAGRGLASSLTPPRRRHRLVEALDFFQTLSSRSRSSDVRLAAQRWGDLAHIVKLFERWQANPSWNELRATVRDPANFDHVLIHLAVASYLVDVGNGIAVGVVTSRGADRPVPDIVLAVDGTTELAVELKTILPDLAHNVRGLTTVDEALRNLDKVYKKAKAQLRTAPASILVVGGFHLPVAALDRLESAFPAFWKRHRGATAIMGAAVVSLGVTHVPAPGFATNHIAAFIAPTLTVRVSANPYYAGVVPSIVDRDPM